MMRWFSSRAEIVFTLLLLIGMWVVVPSVTASCSDLKAKAWGIWEFNANSNNPLDCTGNGHNMTITSAGGLHWNASNGAGNGSWSFKAHGNYIESPSFDAVAPFCMFGWIYQDTAGSGDETIFGDGGGDWYLNTQAAPQIRYRDGDESDTYSAKYGSKVWVLVGMCFDGATERVYKNGTSIGEETDSPSQENGTIYVGDLPAFAGTNFEGHIDQVMFFAQNLSESEIASLYPFCSPCDSPAPPVVTNSSVFFNVSLVSPSDGDTDNVLSNETDFVYWLDAENTSWSNCSLWTNESGVWEVQNRQVSKYDIVDWWDFDVGNATWTEDVVRDYDAVVSGATFGSGFIGGGYSFDGVNDYMELGTSEVLLNNESYALSLWVNGAEAVTQTVSYITNEFILRRTSTGVFSCFEYNGGGWASSNTGISNEDEWYHVVCSFNGTHIVSYLDGVGGSPGATSPHASSGSTMYLGQAYFSLRFNGSLDDVMIFNRSLSAGEVADIYDNTSASFLRESRNNSLSSVFNPSADSLLMEWNVGCYLVNGSLYWGSDANWSYTQDLETPTVNISGSNWFRDNNMSGVVQYEDLVVWNLTFEDNIDLYGFVLNVTRAGGVLWDYSDLTLPANNLSFVFENVSNSSGWGVGVVDVSVLVADKHTALSISDYDVVKSKDDLLFDTAEGNIISVSSPGAVGSSVDKVGDRYSFGFDYDKVAVERTYVVSSVNPISYYEDSVYPGHFVVWNGGGGNWIDFVGMGDVGVVRVSDFEYLVTVQTGLVDKVVFNSIGGLNVYQANYSWYKGGYSTTFEGLVAVGYLNRYVLNMTIDTSYVAGLNATLVYGGVVRNISRGVFGDYVEFVSEFSSPGVPALYNFSWLVNVTQNDSSTYGFSVNESQQVEFAQVNFSFFDEANFSVIVDPLTLYLTKDVTHIVNVGNGSLLVDYLTLGEWFVEAEGENWTRRGRYVNLTHYDLNLSMYLLDVATSNDYIDFILLDSAQGTVEDARMSFYRDYNGSRYLMAQYDSDFAGQVRVWLDQGYEYPISVSSVLGVENLTLRPIRTLYTIFLQQVLESLYDNVFDGITYSISPSDRVLNASGKYRNVTFTLSSSDPSIEYFGLLLYDHSFTCVPASCKHNVSGSVYGGTAVVGVLLDANSSFNAHFFYKRTGFDLQYVNARIYSVELLRFFSSQNLFEVMASLRSGMGGGAVATLFASVMMVVLMVLAAQMGIFGMGLVLVAMMGAIFFMLTGFLALLPGVITVIVGVAVYVAFARQ